MSLFTRDKVILSADRRSYLQYDVGTGRLNYVVAGVVAFYATAAAFVANLAMTFAQAVSFSSTVGVTGVLTPTGGVAAAGGFSASPRNCHTGGVPATQTTDGNDTTPSITETYIAEVFVPANCTVTGIAVLNGSAVAGNIKAALHDSAGAVLGSSASTAASGTDAYQKLDLSTPLAVVGPATYYVSQQCSSTSQRLNTHILGTFGASKKTGETYGTHTAITPPTSFTTAQGPIASLY